MATFDAASSAQTGAEATSLTFAHTVTAGTNMALIVGGTIETGGGFDITSVTYNGDALSELGAADSGSFGYCELWGMVAPDTGSSLNVVITANLSDWIIGGAVSASLVNQTGGASSFRTAATNNSASASSLSSTVGSVGTSDLVVDVLACDSNVNVAEGADQTNRWERSVTGAVTGAGSTQLGSAGGVMSWSWTGARPCAHVASAFIHDGSGAAASIVAHMYYYKRRRAA